MSGTLYGVGLGPGAPDLMTLRAARLIEGASVIAYPTLAGAESFARSIAADLIPDDAQEIVMDVPMSVERAPAQAAYDTGAAQIAQALESGQDVICLCEGDPFFYGSFMYLHARLKGRFNVEVVPGVTSVTACAAEASRPLVARNERLTVLPGPMDEAELRSRIEGAEAVAIMKVGRHLAKIRSVIDGLGLTDHATYIERATLPEQVVVPLSQAPEKAPYFSMILLTKRGRPMALAPVVLALSKSGEPTAHKIASALGLMVHGRQDRVTKADAFFANALDHARDLFASGTPIIGVCASGILIRGVAPLLSDKTTEPPVISVSDDGAVVVPLLGGHRGANRLAREIAQALQGTAAVTTAGDVALGVALDEPPAGWRLSNPQDAKPVMAALLSGETARIAGENPLGLTNDPNGTVEILDTESDLTGNATRLVYHPQRLVLGLGCARGADPEDIWDLVIKSGVTRGCIAAVATIDLKADEPAMIETAKRLGVPLRLFTADELEAEAHRLANPSDIVFAEVGCHGVSEGAALACAGGSAELTVPKIKSETCTVAVARNQTLITSPNGRPRGRLSVVGIGPGQAAWRTPEVSRLVADAEELVGYSLYIDLLGPLAAGKIRSDFPLGGEEARCRYALEQAALGKNVALVCSGDAGIYAMGALVFELLDRAEDQEGVSAAARRSEIICSPGVSALQGAAARAGAPLGHDFCTISLSDLLTPRDDIIRRLKAAAEGDFVIAFYNPVSKTRRTLLAEARDILLQHRPADTPVMLATNLGRPYGTCPLSPS